MEVLVLTPVPTEPATFGNRLRIAELCRVLRAQGARITLLHYPSDEEWRTRMPAADHAAMLREFEAVHLIPVTRPLHTAPWPGPDHAVDEWWDPAIGQMLDWIFSVRRFDAFIVNYTWLSRALEHAPRGVLRILDTHDRFAGRRALLEANGIAPEYFFTTEDEEAKALARADLVWAIKPEEAALFRTPGAPEVVTVPHAEAPRALPMAAPGWRDGAPVLRLGIAGGRNRINAENIRAFLAEAEAQFRRTLLPAEIVVAGSVCDLIPDAARPWVRLMGGVESMDELYTGVDAVLAPLRFSTGLKIKVGEALARGKALIAHAHAFEGYVPTHEFHRCGDFAAMLRAVHRVAREPAALDALEEASRESALRARLRMERAIAHAGTRARERRRRVLIVADAAALQPDSPLFDHLRDAATVLGAGFPLAIHLLGDPARAEPDCLRRIARFGAVSLAPGVEAGLPAFARGLLSAVEPARAMTLDAALQDCDAALFTAVPEELPAQGPPLAAAQLDALALDAPAAMLQARLPVLARRCGRFLLLGGEATALAGRIVAAGGEGTRSVAAPLLARPHDSALVRALVSAPEEGVLVLAERGAAPALWPALAFLVHGLRLRPMLCAADEGEPAPPAEGPLALPAGAVLRLAAADLFRPAAWRRARPRFVAEISAAPRFAAAREIFAHARIPMARLFLPGGPDEALLRAEACARSMGLIAGLLTLDHLARESPRFRPALEVEAATEEAGQAGWAALLAAIEAAVPAG
ncbi:MAG TPA: glycosyltransferase [Acetobacteraceae bacterium]|nr:glycosyltransferase [Acetobacteraceae bacterium]